MEFSNEFEPFNEEYEIKEKADLNSIENANIGSGKQVECSEHNYVAENSQIVNTIDKLKIKGMSSDKGKDTKHIETNNIQSISQKCPQHEKQFSTKGKMTY